MEDERRHEILEHIYAILQDGGEAMAPEDVLDCVFGSITPDLTDEEKEYTLSEVEAITGNKRG